MTKKDLRDGYPNKLMMRDRGDLLRYHASSGTTGKPTIVGYTKNDLENWSESLARAMTSFGLGKKDVIQVGNTYGLFSGGLGFHYATEKIGATVIPASTGNTDRQIELICDLDVTAMAATPSYLMYLGEVAEKKGINIKKDTKLRYGLLGGEPWSDRMRDRIYESMGVKGINCFGASELSGPLFMECAEQDGIHFWRDLSLLEIVDPERASRWRREQKGEMVVTMLQKEAFPIDALPHGRHHLDHGGGLPLRHGTHPRITRIQGRVDDMIIIRGINVFPSQVEHSLMQHPEVGNEFQLVVDRKGHLDTMLVRAELKPEAFTDNIIELNALRERISNRLKGRAQRGGQRGAGAAGHAAPFRGQGQAGGGQEGILMSDMGKYRIKQLSIFSENRPNRLGAVAKVLKEGKINILGFSIAEGAGYGVIRVLVDRPEIATRPAHQGGVRRQVHRGPGHTDGGPPRRPFRPHGPHEGHQHRVRLRLPQPALRGAHRPRGGHREGDQSSCWPAG